MIAISSLRPITHEPTEHNANQGAAWASWQQVFSAIFYFNPNEASLASDKTRFLHWEPFPRILDLARVAYGCDDWCVLLNADIIVPVHFSLAEEALKKNGAICASSWRFEFDPNIGIHPSRVTDNGLDFFAATPEMWGRVASACPKQLRIGTQWFDTWLLAFFSTVGGDRFYDLTPSRVVLHPKHGGRQYGPGFNHRDIQVVGRPIMARRLLKV